MPPVRSVDPTIRGLVLTSFDDEDAAVLAGASGYLLKDIRGNRIVDAIRRVAAGENLLDTQPAQDLAGRWRAGLETDPRLRSLTPQERLVLQHIAEGLTNKQIGEAMPLAEKTVKNYITSVLAEMGLERRTQAACMRCSTRPPRLAAHPEGPAPARPADACVQTRCRR